MDVINEKNLKSAFEMLDKVIFCLYRMEVEKLQFKNYNYILEIICHQKYGNKFLKRKMKMEMVQLISKNLRIY